MKRDEFLQLLKENSISKQEFCNLTGLTLGTINKWGLVLDGKERVVPSWVKSWFELYEKNRSMEELKNIIIETADKIR
jgi:hypothetical protein